MEEGYDLDLTYVTERIIAVSFPQDCFEEMYLRTLRDVTRMLKSKHADNYLTLDTGWLDFHAPPLDKICSICKATESWLNADPLHVVVIHCRVKCFHTSSRTERDDIFRVQFHTGAVQAYSLVFQEHDMSTLTEMPDFQIMGTWSWCSLMGQKEFQCCPHMRAGGVAVIHQSGVHSGSERWQNGPDVTVDYMSTDSLSKWKSYQNICRAEDPLEDTVSASSQSITNSAAELLKQRAACNVWFLGSVEMESLTGFQAVQKATAAVLSTDSLPSSTAAHFKVSSQGITLTDKQRKWKRDGCSSAK
ncbi:hypothetical protein cypCar_00041569 [Cyprinus carpio]|nr:hypothetical protein cypCar_00041569 [Cyprinus carpio]